MVDRIGGELRGDVAAEAEALDGAALGVRRWPGRIGLGRVAQMILDLAGDALGQFYVEVEFTAQRRDVLVDHAGHPRPPRKLSTAFENFPQALRRAVSADAPALVSE